MDRHRSRRLAAPALTAALMLIGAGIAGCGEGTDDRATAPQLETKVPDVRGPDDLTDPYTGLLDARFVEDLPAYEGQEVTVTAVVADVLSPQVFSVTSPDGSDVDPVLVVATGAAAAEPQEGEKLVIAATPTGGFDANAVVEQRGLQVDPADLEDWDDETYLVASTVEPAP